MIEIIRNHQNQAHLNYSTLLRKEAQNQSLQFLTLTLLFILKFFSPSFCQLLRRLQQLLLHHIHNYINIKTLLMQNPELQAIKELFPCQTDICRKNVEALLKDSIKQIGTQQTIDLHQQWKILSQKLNNASKLTNLRDRNHRLMLIEFLKAGAADMYKSSYFNRAKICSQYIQSFSNIGAFLFSQVITIVNKLKLIKKYHSSQKQEAFSEDHISLKIKEILDTCESKKRSDNSNVSKFINIVSFQDPEGLIKELGKMLRNAWAKEKQLANRETNQNAEEVRVQAEKKPKQDAKRGTPDQFELVQRYLEGFINPEYSS